MNACRASAISFLMATLLLGITCESLIGQELPNEYGRTSSRVARMSLNGFSAFSNLLSDKGIEVKTWTDLTPRIEQFDTIVWIPAGQRQATQAESDRLSQWLDGGYERTLVIVLNDYDATRDYLEDVLPTATGEQAATYRRLWEKLVANEVSADDVPGTGASDRFVTTMARRDRRVASQLAGPWATSVRGLPTHIVTNRTITPPSSTLWTSTSYLTVDGEEFIYELNDYQGSRVIVVANGSFLVNYGFVHAGNRELADRLAQEIGATPSILFLESGNAEMSTANEGPNTPSTWTWMQAWPLSFLFPHLLIASVVMYFALVPIFGRPKRIVHSSRSDLGQHIDAIAAIWQRDGDVEKANRTLAHYREHVRQESRGLGASVSRRRRKP